MKTVQFWDAPEVQTIAEELIASSHAHLAEQPMTYVFCAKAPAAKGCKCLGTMSVLGGLNAALAKGLESSQVPVEKDERFFLMKISRPHWITLSGLQKRALVDHELSHAGLSAKGNPTIRPHDVEEFRSIIDRHGFWRDNLKDFGASCAAVASQPTLDLQDAPAAEEAPRPTATTHGMGELNEGTAVLVKRCERDHEYDRVAFPEGCPLCMADAAERAPDFDAQKLSAAENEETGPADGSLLVNPETGVMKGGVELTCGHWMSVQDIAEKKSCAECEASHALRMVDPPAAQPEETAAENGNGAEPAPQLRPGQRKPPRTPMPPEEAAALRQHIDARRGKSSDSAAAGE